MKLNPKKAKKALEKKLMTQTELCRQSDLGITTVNRAMNGIPVHPTTIKKICEVLEVDPKDIM